METRIAKIIQDRAEVAIRDAFAKDPMLSHLTIAQAGGKVGAIDATLKFQFIDSKAKPSTAFSGEVNEDSIRRGDAPQGTEVVFGIRRYSIIRARRTKYEALCKEDEKVYLISFGGCRLPLKTPTETPAPVWNRIR